MIVIPELTQLRNQISEILSTPEKNDQPSDSTAAVPIKNRFSFVHKNIMFAVTFSILLVSAISFPVGDIANKIREKVFGESNVQEQEKKLLGELAPYKKLFQFPIKPTKSSDYKEAFNDLYRYCDLTTMDLDQYLQESYVQNIVQQQRSDQYPVLGTVPDEDSEKLLDNVKGISPVQFRRILAAYKKMQELSSKSDNSDFKSKFNKFKIDFPADPAGIIDNPKGTAQPLFFVQYESAKELDWAMTIHNFIYSIIEDNEKDKSVTDPLSQKSILELIKFYSLFENVNCESVELQGAFDEFCKVLKEIAKESKN